MWGADDPDDRMPMVWADLKFDLQTLSPGGQPTRQDDINFDSTLHDYYRDAIALRKKFPDLVHGKMQMIGAENQSRMFAFARGDANTLFAVFNRHSDPQTFTFQFGNTDGTAPDPLTPILVSSGKPADVQVQQKDGKASITLPGFTGALLKQK
jgi:glycosidase